MPYERHLLLMHANCETVTLSNIPMTRSKLNGVDVITCYLYTFHMFFNSKDGVFFAVSHCDVYAWEKICYFLAALFPEYKIYRIYFSYSFKEVLFPGGILLGNIFF